MTNDYGNLELHQVLLAAMKDFHDLCQKYNLRYCLHGGTALGAIRHKGFIPWDDDVDIAMLREDYDRFLEVAQDELGERYTVQTYKTEPGMLTNVMKIRINDTDYVCEGNGAPFLDIFPMSDVPNTKFLQNMQRHLAIFVNNIIYTKNGYITPTSSKAKLVLGTLARLDRLLLGNILEWIIVRFPHRNSRYVNIVATANYCGNTGYAKDLCPKKYFEELILTGFCGEQFYITKYWHEYLTKIYGDYMTPPPENARRNKHDAKKG